jgi:hypothetical protein
MDPRHFATSIKKILPWDFLDMFSQSSQAIIARLLFHRQQSPLAHMRNRGEAVLMARVLQL